MRRLWAYRRVAGGKGDRRSPLRLNRGGRGGSRTALPARARTSSKNFLRGEMSSRGEGDSDVYGGGAGSDESHLRSRQLLGTSNRYGGIEVSGPPSFWEGRFTSLPPPEP